MLREHFEYLWDACFFGEYGLIIGPEDKFFASEIWQELFVRKILRVFYLLTRYLKHERTEPPYRLLFNKDTETYTILGSKNYGDLVEYKDGYQYPILKPSGDNSVAIQNWVRKIMKSSDGQNMERMNYGIPMFHVNYSNLSTYTAQEWDIKPAYRLLLPKSSQIGIWKSEIPIVVINETDLYRMTQLNEIKDSTGGQNVIVINPRGESLDDVERKSLLKKGIFYINSKEFLTDEGQPRWKLVRFGDVPINGDDINPSVDYRSIEWNGELYSLSALQAQIVRILHENHLHGTPEVGQDTLLEMAGSESRRIEHVFKKSLLWGTLIVPGGKRGNFRLKIS